MKAGLILFAFASLLALSACGSDASSCRCVGDVAEGFLDVACGESACVNGASYVCTGQDEATYQSPPTACGEITPPPPAPDPCTGIVCDDPPPTTCLTYRTLQSFALRGTCVSGQCSYEHQESTCKNGCMDGACLGPNLCAGITCNSPPPASCVDAKTSVTYAPSGVCSGGTCGYSSLTTSCIVGCLDGACTPTCPINVTRSTQVGSGVFTGSFLTAPGTLAAPCFPYPGPVFAWQAPADGVYTFSATCSYDYKNLSSGVTYNNRQHGASILVLTGTCMSLVSLTSTCPGTSYTATLTAGQNLMVALSDTYAQSSASAQVTRSDFQVDITRCQPSCTGRACGSDGCGGTCGSCGAGLSCSSAGACVCVPSCAGRTCGDNGCGGSCGTCSSSETCSAAGHCLCVPSCGGRTCGSNGCGGSCGSCGLGSSCNGTSCTVDPDACDPVLNAGCATPNECILLSNETTRCVLTGGGRQGALCSASLPCDGGFSCFAGSCRKICDHLSGSGCSIGYVCNGVSGWFTYGACAVAP
jgi:hypothetical protein